jgi:ABC-type multidrug transport system fused ATPase/permease subunit
MIMIAHKLETAVRYSDRILVMDHGSVAEFDTASNLLAIEDGQIKGTGVFAEMVRSLNNA